MRILISAMMVIGLVLLGSGAYVGHRVRVLKEELTSINHRVQQEQIQLDRLQALWAIKTSPQELERMVATLLREDSPSLIVETQLRIFR